MGKSPLIITFAGLVAFCSMVMHDVASGISAAGSNAHVIYVRADAPAGGDGSSWHRAIANPAAALKIARSGSQIWVASGTYVPTDDGDRTRSFSLREGVVIYGGFVGNESDLAARNWVKNVTVLSGDIGQKGDNSDNVFHVVTGADHAIIDGFTIRDGNASGGAGLGLNRLDMPPPGMFSEPAFAGPPLGLPMPPPPEPNGGSHRPGQGTHTTPEAIMQGEHLAECGGGMLNYRSAPTVRNCTFIGNTAHKGGGAYNMTTRSFPPRRNNADSVPTYINCTFRKNTAIGRGGGTANDLGTSPVFLSCRFESNHCEQKGGGLYNDFGCSPMLINCLFTGNKAASAAGVGNDGNSCPILYYCTLTANETEDYGPAIYNGTGASNDPIVQRSIIWGNRCRWEGITIYNWHDCNTTVSQSIVEGGYPGENNCAIDPRFDKNSIASIDVGYRGNDSRFSETSLDQLLRNLDSLRQMISLPSMEPDIWNQLPIESTIPTSDRVVYVNAQASTKGNGKFWQSAYNNLDDAITDAERDGAQIWIAKGTYIPHGDDRNASFQLAKGIRLYGGFKGNETSIDQRNPEPNPTILSGDRGKKGNAADNCYHVVIGAYRAMLDGLTIRDGSADGVGYNGKGGGLILYEQGRQNRPNMPCIIGYSMSLINCTFNNNRARNGGAVYNYDRTTSNFIGCHFHHNNAENGGAIYECVGVESKFIDCLFSDNQAKWRGGAAMFDYGSRPALNLCTFKGNKAGSHGGAIFSCTRASQLDHTIVTLSGCLLDSNSAKGDGGACNFHDKSQARINFCMLKHNTAGRRGGAIAATSQSTIATTESVLEANTAGSNNPDVYEEALAFDNRPPHPAPVR